MYTKAYWSMIVLCTARLGCAAPPHAAEKRRESTPEILDLEQQLKLQAGEDKKFFPNPHSPPMPQIDGLEDKHPPIQLQMDDENVQQEVKEGEQGGDEDGSIGKDADINENSELTMNDVAEEEEELLNEENDRKAFVDGLLEALQENPELLNQLMRDGGFDMSYEEDDLQRNDIKDIDDAIQAEMMSAIRQGGASDVSMNIDTPFGDVADGFLEQELEEEGEGRHGEEEPYDLGMQEEKDYEDLLKEIAMNNPDLLQENEQMYQGDADANEVAKKRGYAPPSGYARPPMAYDLNRDHLMSFDPPMEEDSLLDDAGSGDADEPADIFSQGYQIPLQAENNIADSLDEIRNYWETTNQEKIMSRKDRQAAESRRWLYM